MKYLKEKFSNCYISFKQKLKELKDIGSWKGSIAVLAVVTLSLYIIQSYYIFFSHGVMDYIKGTVVLIAAIVLLSGAVTIILAFSRRIPILFVWAALSSFLLLCLTFYAHMQVTVPLSILIVIGISLCGCILYRSIKSFNIKKSAVMKSIKIGYILLVLSALSITVYWIFYDGSAKYAYNGYLNNSDSHKFQLNIDDPAKQGTYTVKQLSYGSGKDLHREDYGQSVKLITESVDGSSFVENWSGLRRKYLGFGPEEMPLNAQVYYPEGEGPFPLIIMVHGNSLMTNYSDTGYAYLGNLLASRGYIFVSVDHNFLNLSIYDDLIAFNMLKQENDARGWLLLQHVNQWERWNNDKNNVFSNKVDMSNIALIGHSRGGEAVSIAAAFNKLKAYPDNGNIKFDFNHNIKSIIAIAPTDGQYKPIDKSVGLKDVNYLLLQGAHDADVTAFLGSHQYNRVEFSPETNYFKASFYIYGANHGQFNETWGGRDGIGLGKRLLETRNLMPKEEQEKIAKVLISAFLDSTLKNNNKYNTLFSDLRYAKPLLPDTLYISNYFDGKTTVISNYEEDIDINSTTLSGGTITGENFIEWKEKKIELKNGRRENSAVHLSWDNAEKSDLTVYSITLPEKEGNLSEDSVIVFSIADGEMKKEKNNQEKPIDLTICVTDKSGNESKLPLSSYMVLQPMISGEIFKVPFAGLIKTKEPVFQNYRFDLKVFKAANPKFIPDQISKVSFIFDRSKRGTVLIDDIGIKGSK